MVLNAVSEEAHACEVLSLPPIEQATADSSAIIFSGKVAEVRTIVVSSGMQDMRAALFEVDTYWKSQNNSPNYKELVVFTAIDSGACGYDFEVGKSYLVYASARDNGSLLTSIGTRTMPIESAQDDTAALGQGISPTVQGSWKEQLETMPMQPQPGNTAVETNNTLLMLIGSGAAIAGAAAFFSLRRLKDKK